MWAFQIRDGKAKGGWNWFQLDLDPWETSESPYYCAAVGALAAGAAPASYRDRSDVRERLTDLIEYLRAGEHSQPLHNRIMLLWAATALPPFCPNWGASA